MWKVGDKIKFIKNGKHDSTEARGFLLNKVYTIINIAQMKNDVYKDNFGYGYQVNRYEGIPNSVKSDYWIEPNSFQLVNILPPKDDVEWLDRVKNNFKDGV